MKVDRLFLEAKIMRATSMRDTHIAQANQHTGIIAGLKMVLAELDAPEPEAPEAEENDDDE
jgi:hypothetical protein